MAETARPDDMVRLAAKVVASVLRGERSDEHVETANVLLHLYQPLKTHHLEVLAAIGSPRSGEGQLVGTADLEERLPHIHELVALIIGALTSAGLVVTAGLLRSPTAVLASGARTDRRRHMASCAADGV